MCSVDPVVSRDHNTMDRSWTVEFAEAEIEILRWDGVDELLLYHMYSAPKYRVI